jgi:uncharacterized protein
MSERDAGAPPAAVAPAVAVADGVAGPVTATERIELIDILRGFALLGILLVNFPGPVGTATSGANAFIVEALEWLVDSSFYPLYSFLFGLGFGLQLLRARKRGGGVLRMYTRRLLALFLIGTAHAVLVWDGDILVNYSLFGFLLIPFHRIRPRPLLAIGLVLLAVSASDPPVTTLVSRDPDRAAAELEEGVAAEELRNEATRRPIASFGSWGAEVAERWDRYSVKLRELVRPSAWILRDVPALFLIGLAIGQLGILQRASTHRRKLVAVAVAGAVTAAIYPVLQSTALLDESRLDGALWAVQNYGYTAFYVCVISLLVAAGGRARRALGILAPAGRLGLTNYLMQSLVMTLLFAGYGLGWTEPSVSLHLLLNVAFFFAIQVPLSAWWLRRYRFGPTEWLWRSVTYGRVEPLRREEPARVEVPARVAGTA